MLHITLNDDQGYCNQISLSKKRLQHFTHAVPNVIAINHIQSAERCRVEQFIESQFTQQYQATISQHYPTFMSVRDANDTIGCD